MIDWQTILAWANAILAGMIAVFQIRLAIKFKLARWIRILLVIIGLYWCALYIFVALVPPGTIEAVYFGQVFVRPAFTVTLAAMAASGLFRLKSK